MLMHVLTQPCVVSPSPLFCEVPGAHMFEVDATFHPYHQPGVTAVGPSCSI